MWRAQSGLLILTMAMVAACGGRTSSLTNVAEAMGVAREYVDAYYQQFPEEAFEHGYGSAPQDRFSSRDAEALATWQELEDGWLERLQAMEAAELAGTEAAIPYAYARERLEASVAMRVCRLELWNVSPTYTGWPYVLSSTFANQSVNTPEERQAALGRARDVARFIDTETTNLVEGLRLGYSAPRSNVDAVIDLLDEILAAEPESSPFWAPAANDESDEIGEPLREIIDDAILPATRRHRNFLAGEYRAGAREEIGVAANPDGAACYAASVRFYTALPLSPEQIHANGLAQMEKIEAEMLGIAQRSFGTEDLPALLERVRTEVDYTFGSEQEILDFIQAAIQRARSAVPDWFGFVPENSVIVRPYPAYQKRTGGGFYSAGTPGQAGIYEIGTYEPRKLPRAGVEATTFHEAYPGHHLQMSVALERAGLHPVLRYFFNEGVGEGWALYTERLADEMGLYSDDLDRLGLLSNEAMRAARLVVDPGMHMLGWSREQALEYLMAHSAVSPSEAQNEIDRYIAVPAQATSYMTGSLEIRRLRDEASAELGEAFDVKRFHDLVLADGTVTLGMLRNKVESWVAAGGK